MFKTILIAFCLMFASLAEAHTQCEDHMVYQPGHYTHHGQWIAGRWIVAQKCRTDHPNYRPVRTYRPHRPWFRVRFNVHPTRPHYPHRHQNRPHRRH